ncbi:MAG: winged helix-turn-helix domain-containing protein [Roseburia inulinivorans]
MEFKKLNAPSLRELFVNELQNMILSGKLEIGSKLPPERELAESMKVSRAVINSGIAELEKERFPRGPSKNRNLCSRLSQRRFFRHTRCHHELQWRRFKKP